MHSHVHAYARGPFCSERDYAIPYQYGKLVFHQPETRHRTEEIKMTNRETTQVEGFGSYEYDQDLYEVAMTQTVVQLRERVHQGCEGMESGTRTKVNKLRKADLAAMVAEWDTGARDNERHAQATEIDPLTHNERLAEDQSVDEAVNGGEVMRSWLELPAEFHTKSVVQTAIDCTGVPSPLREYQSSQEALVVLEAHLADTEQVDTERLIADVEENVPLIDDEEIYPFDMTVPEVDPGFAAEVDALVARDMAADPMPQELAVATERLWMESITLPTTETDVRGPGGSALSTLVQSGSKLVWGRLIAVVNRRSKYSSPLLVTVEIDGVRRLLSADDVLVGDEFVAA